MAVGVALGDGMGIVVGADAVGTLAVVGTNGSATASPPVHPANASTQTTAANTTIPLRMRENLPKPDTRAWLVLTNLWTRAPEG